MYTLSSRIEIEGSRKWEITFATAIEAERDTEKLTDTCRITFPKRMSWDGQKEVPLRTGDRIKVWTGYDGRLELLFAGYIKDVGFKSPLVLTCEDEMFRLKQTEARKLAYRNVDLETLLKDQGLTDVKVFGEQQLGAYRIVDDTVAAVLGRLHENGVRSFFRYEDGRPVLYCGVLFERKAEAAQVFETGVNIISDQSLEQQRADSMRLCIKAVSIMPDNTKIKVEVGDMDGEKRTLHTYNKSESELRRWAEQEIRRAKVDGLTGTLTTFGYRIVDKLDAVGVKIDGRKTGVYLVKKNIVKYGSGGYRQEVTLGYRIA